MKCERLFKEVMSRILANGSVEQDDNKIIDMSLKLSKVYAVVTSSTPSGLASWTRFTTISRFHMGHSVTELFYHAVNVSALS